MDLLAIAVVFIPYPQITDDKLLVSVFGGFFLGAGIGFTIRGGAVIDGTEILAIFMSRKTKSECWRFYPCIQYSHFLSCSFFTFGRSCHVCHANLPGRVKNG